MQHAFNLCRGAKIVFNNHRIYAILLIDSDLFFCIFEDITVVFEYPYLNGIMRIVKEDNPAIISQKFEMDCEMTLRIRKGEAERLKNRLLKVETAYLKE